MKYILLIFNLLFIINPGFGQIHNVKNGLWSDNSTWSNNLLPTLNDAVILNFDITIDVDCSCKSLETNGHNVTINSGINFLIAGSKSPKKLTLIEIFDEESLMPTEYYKISYDTVNHNIYIDSDTTNVGHEYIYEYNNNGELIKSKHLGIDNSGQASIQIDNEYIRNVGAIALQIKSIRQGITSFKNYYKSNNSDGYSITDTTVFIDNIIQYEKRDFTNLGLPKESLIAYIYTTFPFHKDSISYKYLFQNQELLREIYFQFNNQEIFRDTANYSRAAGSTKLVFDFIKTLKGSDLLYIDGDDDDQFIHFIPFLLGVDIFQIRNYSNKEILGASNSFYPSGELKQSDTDNNNRWRKVFYYD